MPRRVLSQTEDAKRQRAWKLKPGNAERIKAWNKEWIENNRDRYNVSKWAYRDRLKAEVIAKYSHGTMRCAQCGFANIDALCLDHINDDGAEQRRLLKISQRGGSSGYNTYEGVKAAGYPPGLQVLCANCNLIKEIARKRTAKWARNKYHHPKALPPAQLSIAISSGYAERV